MRIHQYFGTRPYLHVQRCEAACYLCTGLETEIDIFQKILHLRQQRSGFVQTDLQYKFIYLAVKRYIEQRKNPPVEPTVSLTSCVAVAGAADTPPPAYNNPTSQGLYSWPWQLIVHASTAYTKFELKFVGDTLLVSALIGLVTLTFDLLMSNRCALLPVRWATFLTILLFWDFSFSTYGLMPTAVIDGSRDLASLTFNLGAHGLCR